MRLTKMFLSLFLVTCMFTFSITSNSLVIEAIPSFTETKQRALAANTSLTTTTRDVFYADLIESESEWLASLQLSNGAIPMTFVYTSGQLTVNPYFASISALALLESGTTYLSNVEDYLDWHFANLNTSSTDYNGVDGTIYDYTVNVTGGTTVTSQVSTNSYDSTDSYAALFLSLLWRYYEVAGSSSMSYLQSHYAEINRIVNALFSTMNNGLTYAKPDYTTKYLMDNTEVYRGLVNAQQLYQTVLLPGFTSGSSAYTSLTAKYNQITTGITNVYNRLTTTMWNSLGSRYYAYLGQLIFSWNTFYPDATSQLYMITNGVLTPGSTRAQQIYNKFNTYWSTGATDHSWDTLDTTDSFYWGTIAYAAAIMSDWSRVNNYMDAYMAGPAVNHVWPLYNADSAMVIRAAKLALDYYS